MSCYRVPAHYFRQDAEGQVHVVDRGGPIIDADSPAEAKVRAETICMAFPDFASVGEAVLLHERGAHLSTVPRALTRELRPIARDAVPLGDPLGESLLRMVVSLRARRSAGRGG